jgi:hypothetical protein
MAECEGLALVTLAKMENDQVNKGELARVATQSNKLLQSLDVATLASACRSMVVT